MARSDLLRRAAGALAVLALCRIAISCGVDGADGADSCRSDADCPKEEYCQQGYTSAGACSNMVVGTGITCLPYGKQGDSCEPGADVRCAAGLVCNQGMGGKCAPLQDAGGPCAFNAECAGAGLTSGPVCNGALGVCGPPGQGAEGDPCGTERACGPDLTCAGANPTLMDSMNTLCVQALPEGTSCAPLAPYACADGLDCVSGTCARP